MVCMKADSVLVLVLLTNHSVPIGESAILAQIVCCYGSVQFGIQVHSDMVTTERIQ